MKNLLFLLMFIFPLIAKSQKYSWETQQAKVLPNGDLEWPPQAFQLVKGSSVRYIDFENGNDSNDGQSTSTAWKHHPWDPTATGNAKASTGIQTFIFKRGVIYRGVLTAKESGVAGNPVRLSSDPDWGTGEASIYGSVKISGGWTKANATIAPNIPNPELVWYRNISGIDNLSKVVCEISETGIKRVLLARSPNYVDTPNEPMQKWWAFTAKSNSGGVLKLTDTKNLIQTNPNHYKGGDVWAIEDVVTMATLWKQKITEFTPATKTIQVSDPNFGGKDCKYYIENTPFLLDAPGEYYYDRAAGKIFIRLEGDKDPNTTNIEMASKSTLLTISGKNYIEISGLTLGFTTFDNVRFGTGDGVPSIKISNSSNITIKNCKFQYLNGGVMNSGSGKNFVFSDNEMNYMDDFALFLEGADEVSILRNKILECGTRHLGRWYSSIPAINGTLSVGEIAGNIIEHAWGSGINIAWGKGSDKTNTVPFIRGLVHHNRVSHSLQGVNDYGGIESWQGGPVFTYNNISEDAQGWHYNWTPGVPISLGYPFYFDGAFKQYAFNNLVKGTGFDRTGGAYMQVLGFYNMYVHNVAYNVRSFSASGDGALAIDGGNYYLGNVSDSTWHQFDHNTRSSGIPFESFGNNFFSAKSFIGNFLSPGGAKYTFDQFYDKLNSFTPDMGEVGAETSKRAFENPSAGDFRPSASSELIDKGVKFFAPFPLSNVVGEWHFQKHMADSSLIKGENFFFTSEFVNRETYNNVPKNHIKAYGLSAESFVKGDLEDFADCALVFDGEKTWCTALHAATGKTICNNVDMTTNSFILEIYFKTEEGSKPGTLISKFGNAGYGYQLDLTESGNARFSLMNSGTASYSNTASTPLTDGKWHHVLLEVNRQQSKSAIYIDGILDNGAVAGTMPASASLTNTADLMIGKNKDGYFFKGIIDFIRISKGTLADAKTTIDELYKWQFSGPFLRDFTGAEPVGKRDAGAIERGGKICNMTVNPNPLYFDLSGGIKYINVEGLSDFEITKKVGTFFNAKKTGNTIEVSASSLSSGSRSGEIWVYGCNETRKVKIIQQLSTPVRSILQSQIKVFPNPLNGRQLTISVPAEIKSGMAKIMDINGKTLSEKTIYGGDNLLNLSLGSGIYLIQISGKELNYTNKIIVN